MRRSLSSLCCTVLAALLVSGSAGATFHFMQIEQVIGGVDGNTSLQAIQLRMRAAGQNLVSEGRLIVRDAAGANPIILLDLSSDVTNPASGARVLIASADFAEAALGTGTPDFILDNLIPESYLAAGSLTFEGDSSGAVWRISWGGASYTGATTGTVDNDANGDFGTPFAGALPSTGLQSLQFQGASTAPSTTNAADYALSASPAVFTANDGSTLTVQLGPPVLSIPPGAPVGGIVGLGALGAALAALAIRRARHRAAA